jgi:hypothetical protein
VTRFVGEMDMIPRWYGIAWHEPVRGGAVVAPIGVNVVLGALRALYVRVSMCLWPDDAAAAFERGYTQGRQDGVRIHAARHADKITQARRAAYRLGREHEIAWMWMQFEIDRNERSAPLN